MVLFTALRIASLFSLVTAAPTSTSLTKRECTSTNFIKPWTLTDITVYTPQAPTANVSNGWVSFSFCDQNEGMQTDTTCNGTVTDGSCAGEDGAYVFCQNSNVTFKLDQKTVMIAMAYEDPCLGPPPWDGGMAFGQNDTQMSVLDSMGGGVLSTQEEMLVTVTQMA